MPTAFTTRMTGPEGPYDIAFTPLNEWDYGKIDVTIAGVHLTWAVERSDQNSDGTISISGMTAGTEGIWQDQFWFELVVKPRPSTITYWGDQVVWRVDNVA